MRLRNARQRLLRHLAAAHPFADGEQGRREQQARRDPRTGAEPALLDGIAHQEQPAEPQRQPAEPDGPARADQFLEGLRPGGRAKRLGFRDGHALRRRFHTLWGLGCWPRGAGDLFLPVDFGRGIRCGGLLIGWCFGAGAAPA